MNKLALAVCSFAALASAATVIPISTIQGTDIIGGASGPSVTLMTSAALTDVLTLTARGQVFLQSGSTYGTNAAGVVTTAGSTAVGGTSGCGCGPYNYASLLVGNAGSGFFQIFPANVANGLSSATPPSLLNTAVTLGSLGFASALPAGTVLQFRIADINTYDNGGSFTFFGDIGAAGTPTPEPATVTLVGAGLAASFWLRRRKA